MKPTDSPFTAMINRLRAVDLKRIAELEAEVERLRGDRSTAPLSTHYPLAERLSMSETNETPKRPSGHLGTMDDVDQTHCFDLFSDGSLVIQTKKKGFEGVAVRHVSHVDIEAYRRALLRGLLPDDPLWARLQLAEAEVERLRAELKKIIGTTVEAKVTYSAPPPAEPY